MIMVIRGQGGKGGYTKVGWALGLSTIRDTTKELLGLWVNITE